MGGKDKQSFKGKISKYFLLIMSNIWFIEFEKENKIYRPLFIYFEEETSGSKKSISNAEEKKLEHFL